MSTSDQQIRGLSGNKMKDYLAKQNSNILPKKTIMTQQ